MSSYQDHSSGKGSRSDAQNNPKTSPAQRPAVPALQKTENISVQQPEGNNEYDQLLTDSDPLQKKQDATMQFRNSVSDPASAFIPAQLKGNNTGLPDNLKAGVESLSGTSLSDVKVHYGSSQPAQYNALAYAQGTDIHIGPGQEQHLPHEAWHVAQQKQGRVQATAQMKGAGINDDAGLEKEADIMGDRAMNISADALASGYEHLNAKDISDVQAQSSLVSTTQRQSLESINSEVSVSLHRMNTGRDHGMAKHTVAQLQSGRLLADYGEELKPGQLHKSNFLSLLRAEVKQIAAEVLEPIGLAQDNCPDLNYWMSYYNGKDAAYFEAAMVKYAPATANATNSEEYLAALTDKIRDALTKHVNLGINEFDPEKAPEEVEGKRPPVNWVPIQRKENSPIQFGCGSTNTVQDPAKSTGSGGAAATGTTFSPVLTASTGTGMASQGSAAELKEAEIAAAATIKGRAEQLRGFFVKKQYEEMGKLLWQEAKKDPTQEILTREGPQKFVSNYINACSETATAISKFVTNKDSPFTDKESKRESVRMHLLKKTGDNETDADYKVSDQLEALLTEDENDKYYNLSWIYASHHLTIIKLNSAYDIYESDANAAGVGQAGICFIPTKDNAPNASASGAALSLDGLRTNIHKMLVRMIGERDSDPADEEFSITVRPIDG